MSAPEPLGRRITAQVVYLALAAVMILIDLLPAGLSASDRASPNLLFMLTAAFAVRNPQGLPVMTVFVAGLTFDLLHGGPLGIGAACLIVSAEILRHLSESLRRANLAIEWLAVGGFFVGTTVVQILMLWLSLSPRPSLETLLGYVGLTLLFYPVMTGLVRVVLGHRRGFVESRFIG